MSRSYENTHRCDEKAEGRWWKLLKNKLENSLEQILYTNFGFSLIGVMLQQT